MEWEVVLVVVAVAAEKLIEDGMFAGGGGIVGRVSGKVASKEVLVCGGC